VKLPPGWSYDPPKKTQERLFEERKRSNLPDISFDLDRDGKVGGQDLVIGKLFDRDGDGRLNTGERKEADKAVAEVRGKIGNSREVHMGSRTSSAQSTFSIDSKTRSRY
jgi:hypothetical protein